MILISSIICRIPIKLNLYSMNFQNTDGGQQKHFYNLLLRVGALGRYQYICLGIWTALQMISASILNVNPFLFFQSSYVCDGLGAQQCKKMVCSLPYQLRNQYLGNSLPTMIDKFKDYRCDNLTEISQMQSIIYFAGVIGAIAAIYFNSYIRKKIVVQICMLISIVCILLLLVIQDIIVMVSLLSLNYVSQCTIIALITLFITQNVIEQQRSNHIMIIFIFFSIGCICNGLFFQFFAWEHVICYYFIGPMAIIFLLLKVYVKQDPFDLVINCTPEEAFRDLHWIAQQNGNQNTHLITIEEIREMKQEYQYHMQHKQQQDFHVFDLFKYSSLRSDVICCSLMHFFIYFNYGSPILSLNQFSESIYINDMVFSSAALFTSIFCFFTISSWPRKKLVNYTTIGTFMVILPLYLKFTCTQSCQKYQLMETIFIFAFKVLLQITYQALFLIQNELFPTQIRSLAYLLFSLFSSISNVFIPVIANLNDNNHFVLPSSFIVSGIIILITMGQVKQSVDLPPPQFIQQLAYKRKKQIS